MTNEHSEREFSTGVLAAVGNTPLVRLNRLFADRLRVYAKLECFNPGGSVKDRAARRILEQAIRDGSVHRSGLVVESSSGNLGISLAHMCRHYGLRFRCVVDARTSHHTRRIIRALGATVEVVEDSEAGETLLQARLRRVAAICREHPDAFWPNQYANLNGVTGHLDILREVTAQLGNFDFIFCAVSTCGTLRGCSTYIRNVGSKARLIAADACGSAITGGLEGERLLPGHGSGIRPPLYSHDLAHRWVRVSDIDCVRACRALAQAEGIFAGASSGAVIHAIRSLAAELGDGATCVAVLADGGDRYLDTVYSDEWVETHFGAQALATIDLDVWRGQPPLLTPPTQGAVA